MYDLLNQPFPPARLLVAASAVASTIAIAACGSNTPTSRTAATRTNSPNHRTALTRNGSKPSSSMLAFSKCMRTHGVPNFPDLKTGGILTQGGGQTITVNGVTVSAPAYLAARAHCQKYLRSIHASPEQAAQQHQRDLEFARCMRTHGVPNFPDPKVLHSSGGNQQVYLPGINPQSPAVQSAARACGGGPKGP